MKLYDTQRAPNPRRVRIFLKEKGLSVPMAHVDLMKGEHKLDAFRAKNPSMRVPVLELDDGTFISETVAICRYFEETHPEPPLMGIDARDRALVEMWQRRMELELMQPISHCFRHTNEALKPLEPVQVGEWGELNRSRAEARMRQLDGELAGHPFIAGERYSIADITALVAVDFGRAIKLQIADDCANLKRWHEAVSARPSAKA